MRFLERLMDHRVNRYRNTPLVVVRMRSPYTYDATTHQMFADIVAVTDAIEGPSFVAYDFTNFQASPHDVDLWFTAQTRNARGSISDEHLQTMFIGDPDQLTPLADAFLASATGVPVGIHETVESAVQHAHDASRVFAAW
jgi:hypothetical protein